MFLATGHGTKGIHLAPITAKIIADHILQGSGESLVPEAAEWMEVFGPGRFVVNEEPDFNMAARDVEE